MSLSLKNSSPDSKADFSKKLVIGIWRLILSRYNTKRYIYDMIWNIKYIYIKDILKISTTLAIYWGLVY